MELNAANKLMLHVHSTRESVSQVTDALAKTLEKADLPEEVAFDVKLAVQEAVINAVEHGNESDPTRMVHVTCECGDGAVTAVVRDEGEGFDPAGVLDPTLPENVLREHCRGIFLIRNLCDEVRFNKKGNQVTIVKKIPG